MQVRGCEIRTTAACKQPPSLSNRMQISPLSRLACNMHSGQFAFLHSVENQTKAADSTLQANDLSGAELSCFSTFRRITAVKVIFSSGFKDHPQPAAQDRRLLHCCVLEFSLLKEAAFQKGSKSRRRDVWMQNENAIEVSQMCPTLVLPLFYQDVANSGLTHCILAIFCFLFFFVLIQH